MCEHFKSNTIISHYNRNKFRGTGRSSKGKGKGSPYSITERGVPELIAVLGSRPAGDMSHKPGGRLPLLSARPAVTLATLKRAAGRSSVNGILEAREKESRGKERRKR